MSGAIGESEACARAADAATEQYEDDPQNTNGSEPITILDVLNPDCWRAVLDWLDVDDVVRSERVSRGWQQVVQEYIQGVHSYFIVTSCTYETEINHYYKYSKYCKVKTSYNSYLISKMLKKIGPFIVTLLVDTYISRWLHYITENCPNLEDVTFFRVKARPLSLDGLFKNCKRLKRVTFESCTALGEYTLDRLIKHETLEELVINNGDVSGYFLRRLKSTNLKKLAFNQCNNLKFEHIISAASVLTELTGLELNDYRPDLFEKVHLLLDKTPKLEHLSLNGRVKIPGFCTILSNELVESIGRLSRLKHLSMNKIATDALLVAVARGCKELRTLNIEGCPGVSGPAVVSLCRELPALAELSVAENPNLSDDDLAACITSCCSLTLLDVSRCAQVSAALVAACARAVRRRPRPLRLRLEGTGVNSDTDQALFAEARRMGLALSWSKPSKIQYYKR